MLRKVCLIAVFFVVLAGLAPKGEVATSAAGSLTPCDYVARYKIIERPQEITADDLMCIDEFSDFGPATMTALQAAVPINSVSQLLAVPNIGDIKAFLLRIFFNLGGQETC